MNVLIVGGAGYVGGAVTDRLMGAPHGLRVYDSLLYEEEYRKPVEFVLGDVRDRARLKGHLAWADVVVWLAALVGDGACAADPGLTREINEGSVAWLARNFDRRVLFVSTCSVYGANAGLLDEGSALRPQSLYAETKLKAEGHLAATAALTFRLGTLFGVADTYSRIRMDLVVNTLTAQAFYHRRITVNGGGQYRPLLHVRDVAEAIVANLDTPLTGVYNLHKVNMRIMELAEKVREHFPGLEIHRAAPGADGERDYRVSSEKAVQAFGFAPLHSVDDGVQELKKLLAEGRIKNVNNPRYSNTSFMKNLVAPPAPPPGPEAGKGPGATSGPRSGPAGGEA